MDGGRSFKFPFNVIFFNLGITIDEEKRLHHSSDRQQQKEKYKIFLPPAKFHRLTDIHI